MVMQMGNPLPKSAVALGRKLVKRVLPSGGQLRRATGLSRDQFQDGIRCLTNAGLVRSAEFGSLVRPVRRYWLSQEGLNHFGASEEEKTWHGDDAIGTLILYDMPKVEAVHAVADRYATGGRTISAVHFVEEWPLCAVVEITVPGEGRPALLVICWASTMDTQSKLFHRLEAIPEAMLQRTLTPDDQCFPAAMAVVGHSEWSVARALTMASVVLRKWIPPSHITAWYHRDDVWHMSDGRSATDGVPPGETPGLLPPIPLLRPVPNTRGLGNKRIDRLIPRLLWSGRSGQKSLELLTLVGDFPVGAVGQYRALSGEAPRGKQTEKRFRELIRLGLVEVCTTQARAKASKRFPRDMPVTLSEIGQGADRYVLSQTGRTAYSRMHGGHPYDLPQRTDLGRLHTEVHDEHDKSIVLRVEDRWPYQHEDIIYHVLAEFAEGGCPIAPGWQARTALARGRGIHPDGKVLIISPLGLRWHNIEVELSDTSYGALKPRCAKYNSSHRRDDDPVLFICPHDRAERNLHWATAELAPRPRIFTATLRRLKDWGVFGDGAWVEYGTPVSLAAPGLEAQE